MGHLPCRDTDTVGFESPCDLSMSDDVVTVGGLLDPKRLGEGELLHVFNGLSIRIMVRVEILLKEQASSWF